MTITVSIIVPIYNVAPYIERCVRSVMAQKYTNLECILVDDCTPDDSIEKCERMIAEYNGPIKFKILHHDHNRGLSAARNTGTDAASGEYIYYLDSDDEIVPDCIEIMAKEIDNNPKIEMVCGDSLELNFGEQRIYHFSEYKQFDNNTPIRYSLFCPEQTIPVIACNKLISLRFIRDNNLHFVEGLIHEDELWIVKAILRLNHLILLPYQTYKYYFNSESIVSATSQRMKALSMTRVLTEIVSSLDEPFYKLALYKYSLRLFWYYRYLPTLDYQSAAKAFSKALWRIRDRKLAIAYRLYFRLNRVLHIRRYEKALSHRLNSRYLLQNQSD